MGSSAVVRPAVVSVVLLMSIVAGAQNSIALNDPSAVVPVEHMTAANRTASTYNRIGVRGKLGMFARNAYAPNVFIAAAFTAGKPDLITIPRKPTAPVNPTRQQQAAYDAALQKYGTVAQRARDQLQEELRWRGRRFVAGFAEGETRAFLQNFMLPVITREDPRYFRAEGPHNPGYRMLYAISRLAVTRSDSGHRTINLSHLLGAAGGAMAARYYYQPKLGVPQLTTTQHMLKSIGGSLALDATFDIVREFWPRRNR